MPSSKRSTEKTAANAAQKETARNDLIDALLTLRTSEEAKRFLSDICTPKEINDLADRWWVAQLLDKGGKSYRAIHALTGVSLTTIGRVARFLQQEPHHGYRVVLDRIGKTKR